MSLRKTTVQKLVARYADSDLVSSALTYAADVVSGKIPSGTYTRLACERQLKDLTRKGKAWPYRFDVEEAERVCAVIQTMPHTKGKWASKKEQIKLEPWQLFIVTTLFGWMHKDKDVRRFREGYISVPRKNGKSILAAAIGNAMFAFDDEYGAEVYCGATTERQAWEVFKPAKLMMKKSPDLCDELGVEINAKALSIQMDASKFEPVVGDPGDGSSPSCAIIDEYHEHKNTALFDTMATGMGAREQPMLFVITTAGVMHGGPCYMHQRDMEKMLDGVLVDESKFAIIYHAEPEDDWASPATLAKANPNMGVSVNDDWLLSMQQSAINSPVSQNRFRTKHLNQWVSAKTAFFNMAKWAKCANAPPIKDLKKGTNALFSIDLSSQSDFTVLLRLFVSDDDKGRRHYYAYPRFFLPGDAVFEDKTGNYQKWLNEGLLEITEGNEVDFNHISAALYDEMEQWNCQMCAFDPWRATQLAQQATDDGATMVEYRNTTQRMSEPMKEFEAAVNGGRFHFDGNEILTWMASNTVAKIDANSNVFPRKEVPENKIDGIVAAIMGIGLGITAEDPADLDGFINNMVTG